MCLGVSVFLNLVHVSSELELVSPPYPELVLISPQRADDDRREYEERLAAENAESERRRTATEAAQREVDRAREEARQRKLTSRAAWDDEKKTDGPRRDVDIEG
jgi:hypothetical protein